MSGYHWYDRLTRISGLRFTFDQDGAVYIFASETVDAPERGLVENLNLLVEVSNATAETITVPAPVAIVFDASWHCCLDAARSIFPSQDLTAVVSGKRVSVRVDLGGPRHCNKQHN